MPEDRITALIRRWRESSAEKSEWHSHYDELARVMLPRRVGFAETTISGGRRVDDIYDGTPMMAARGLSNAIGGMMRPGGIPEFEMEVDEDRLNGLGEVQDWLGDSLERFQKAILNPRARYVQASGEKDRDIVVLGTAVMFTGSGRARNHLLYQTVHLKDATPIFDDEGRPEGLFRKRRMKFRHVAARFGEEALSAESRQKFKDKPDARLDVLHAVLPREDGRPDALFAKDLPFSSIWVEIDTKHKLAESGFHEFPFAVPRWDTSSGEDLGRSPGMIALPDADTLQAMGETILIAGQRAADPPLAVPNDGSFDAINTFPGGLAYYDIETASQVGGNPFFAIESRSNLSISRDMQDDTRQSVFAAFFRNILNLPVEGPKMTATEVIQRKEEFIREIGPVFGHLENDDTAPTMERSFMVQLRSGGFAQIPEVLADRNVIFVYESVVKRIRQQIDASAARMWAEEMFTLAQVKPDAADLVNVDGIGRFSHKALGLPREIINSPEQVSKIQAARQAQLEAAQQQQEAAAAIGMADVAAGAAQKAGMTEVA